MYKFEITSWHASDIISKVPYHLVVTIRSNENPVRYYQSDEKHLVKPISLDITQFHDMVRHM